MMSEILILIHGKRFLISKIRIKLLLKKNLALTEVIQVITCSVSFSILRYLLVLGIV